MEASLADNKNITSQDVADWMRQAPHDQLVTVLPQAIDRIASSPQDYRDRFTQMLTPNSRKLFQGEPVG